MTTLENILNSILGQGPLRFLLDFALLVSLGGYLLFYLLGLLKSSKVVRKSSREALGPRQDLLHDLADAILGIDGDDRIVVLNRRAESLFGFSSADLTKRNYQSLLILPDGFSESSARQLKSNDKVIGLEHQAWGLRSDGSRFGAHVVVTPCRRGVIRALVAIRESRPPDSQALTLPGIEPATLLSSAERIRRFATLLGNSSDLSKYDREFLFALQKSTDDLYFHLSLSRCLLAIENNEIQADPQPLHLGQWLEKESISYRELAQKRGVHLSLPLIKTSGLIVLTDEKILGRVFRALLDFALKTYQSPAITLHLTSDPTASGPYLPGLWKPTLEHVHDGQDRSVRFLFIVAASITDSVQPVEDQSLVECVEADPHIRMARQLVPLIGANMSVDANDFSGLMFQFSLSCQSFGVNQTPALPEDPPVRADEESGEIPEPESLEKQAGTILSIAEDSDLKKWVRDILVAEGFRVEECPPDKAIEEIRDRDDVDLVVLQRELSQEPDFDLTYEIRQFRKAEDMPILLVHTGEHPDPKISYFNAQAAIDFPSENSVLKEKVNALCESRIQRIGRSL